MGEQSEANPYAKKQDCLRNIKRSHLQNSGGGYAKKQSISAVKAVDAETLFQRLLNFSKASLFPAVAASR